MSQVKGNVRGHAVYRPEQTSRRGFWIKLSLLTLVAGILGGGAFYSIRTGTFDVVEVRSGSYRYTEAADLDQVLETFLHRNLWTLSEGEVAAGLSSLPWIQEVQVQRELPGTLEVEFSERRPVLSLASENSETPLVLVDDGHILPFPKHLPLPALPVLVGVATVTDSIGGHLELDPQWAAQVDELLLAMAATGLESVAAVDFLVARPEGFAIVLQEGRGTLQVGHEDFASGLDRYLTARDHLKPGVRMDLRFRDRIVCRRN